MVRPVPGHEARVLALSHFAEANEGLRLVGFPAHGRVEATQRHHVRVDRVVEERGVPTGAVERAIEQPEPLFVAVMAHPAHHREDGPHEARRLAVLRELGEIELLGEEVGDGFVMDEAHRAGRHVPGEQSAEHLA